MALVFALKKSRCGYERFKRKNHEISEIRYIDIPTQGISYSALFLYTSMVVYPMPTAPGMNGVDGKN